MVEPGTATEVNLPARPKAWEVVLRLTLREILRFARQGSRVVGAVLQPVIFWVFFSAGFDRTFRVGDSAQGGDASFGEYYFPGTLLLILLFTAIFSTISVIEDRREGFLQSVLVAPIPRWSMVAGKVLGGSLLALAQGCLFLLLAFTLDVHWGWANLVQLIALMLVASVGLTSLGLTIAWRMESTQGFHAMMSVFLMPLWLLSGAFFPVPELTPGTPVLQAGLHWVMRLNPLTYTLAGLHRLVFDGPVSAGLDLPGLAVAWTVTGLFSIVMLLAACRVTATRTAGDLL
jgi:ABC-2 type transport system permease protein